MKSTACQMLGIDLPIVLAPMGGAVGPDLAAAVSNAGGLGLLPLWFQDIPTVRDIVRATRALTSAPFGANLNMEFPQDEALDACLEEDVRIISFFWQNPGPLLRRAKDAGAIVLQTVASAEDARRAVDNGADILVAQGWEAGGHVRGMVSTMALVPRVVDVAGNTPVIAAGGIADGRGLAAVLALGAGAGWIGTRFLASHEAVIHKEYQEVVLRSSESDTIHLDNLFDGGWPDAPHRVIRNSTVTAWENSGRPAPGHRPNEGQIVAQSPDGEPIIRYECLSPRPDITGDIEALALWAGQGVGLAQTVKPAAEIVEDLAADARRILSSTAF